MCKLYLIQRWTKSGWVNLSESGLPERDSRMLYTTKKRAHTALAAFCSRTEDNRKAYRIVQYGTQAMLDDQPPRLSRRPAEVPKSAQPAGASDRRASRLSSQAAPARRRYVYKITLAHWPHGPVSNIVRHSRRACQAVFDKWDYRYVYGHVHLPEHGNWVIGSKNLGARHIRWTPPPAWFLA